MAAAGRALAAFNVDLFESDTSSDESDHEDAAGLPRMPFTIDEISERLLFQRTRLNRHTFLMVLELITPALTRNTRRGRYQHITPMQKLYVTLQFYATGTFQWLCASSGNISQSSASHAIDEVTNALVQLAPRFIKFPTGEEVLNVKRQFYALGAARHGVGFPNVLGAIDCTHVRIRAPKNVPAEQYLNRHIYYSINVQLIVGPDLKIYNVFAEYPGSNHDSFIWRNSAVHEALANGNEFAEGWLVGDSGYPQEPWLMTPVTNITTPAEQLYNGVHISTRNPVERANGLVKSRFPVLDSPLRYTPAKVCAITTACCVLHNICIDNNVEIEDFQDHPLNDDFQYQGPQNPNYDNARSDLIVRHFTR